MLHSREQSGTKLENTFVKNC